MDKTRKKSLVLIDDSNYHYGFNKLDWSLDYKKYYNWLNENFSILDIYFFGGLMSRKAYLDKNPSHKYRDFTDYQNQRSNFFKLLKRTGIKVRTKPVASIYDSTEGVYRRKCNFDVEITIIALDKLNEYDELILCSGDGDFLRLIKYVKGKYKKATLIVHKDRLNGNLKEAAHRTIYLEDIKDNIKLDK